MLLLLFLLHEFLLTACAGIFFQVKPSARIFFSDKYAFFSVKSRFIIYFALNILFYTHNRSKDTGHFLIMCARSFRKCTERGLKQPRLDGSPVHFCSPCPLKFLCDKNRVKNSYPGVIAALKVLFVLVYLYGSAFFLWYDRGIFEYFAKRQ